MDKILIGKNIIRLDIIDSTNNYAINLSKSIFLNEGTVIVCSNQKDGRGLGDNYWESEEDKNLTFSVILYPEFIPVANQFILSKAISLAIVDYLNMYIDIVNIKWPNDIYVDDKKISGILIENYICGDIIQKSIVGIGLNINQTIFKSDAPNPTSLKNITGFDVDLNEGLNLLLSFIENRYFQLQSKEGIEEINNSYLNLMYRIDEFAQYESDKGKFTAKITGVDNTGKLLMTDKKNNDLSFNFKEVTFLHD